MSVRTVCNLKNLIPASVLPLFFKKKSRDISLFLSFYQSHMYVYLTIFVFSKKMISKAIIKTMVPHVS
ncbi:hypothetical protein BD770DRAFT_390331 [Pilaira anomala]|nr:hypothetical protein BD770DRAFT_390331 [Pilaira anomala]